MLHEPLKDSWSIRKAEWHDAELVESLVCHERRLLFGCWVHPDLPKSRGQVDGRKVLRLSQLVKQIVDTREWESVRLCHGIQRSVINTKPVCAIAFPYQYYRTCPWRSGRLDDSSILHLAQLSCDFLSNCKWHPAGSWVGCPLCLFPSGSGQSHLSLPPPG